jgi:photosystem II stability/assembly factor-like uncharacterized protein
MYSYGRIWHSWDRGDHWSDTAAFFTQGSPKALSISESGIILATSTYTMFKSTNVGATWDTLIYSQEPNFIATKRDSFYYDTYFGLGKYSPEFESDLILRLPLARMTGLAIAPNHDMYLSADSGLYRSSDNGLSWWHLRLPHQKMTCIAIDSNGRIFTGTDSGRVFITTNNGSSWTSSVLSSISNTHGIQAILVTQAGHIYTAGGQGIWRSEDHGQTWVESNDGLVPPYSSCLALSRDGYLYSGFISGIYRSTSPVQ